MEDINLRFKDSPPNVTVTRIKNILTKLGIRVTEHWKDSGLENCWSLRLTADGIFPFASNGKGISQELARASAYGEFIERLQCGLMLYKYQSIPRDSSLYLQSYAPDGKYVTMQELIDDGAWMDPIISTYKGNLTRKKIAQLCRSYACADRDAIWVVPFYSLFENKYVYLPAAFVEQVYCTNGCCAGNTREEAWLHALSEIMERHSTISMLLSGKAAPKIPESVISNFPIASKILDAVRSNKMLDIDILDFSQGKDYPVIATRLINKATHGYRINVCADPILEIAVDRTLTEVFQGHNVADIGASHVAATYDESEKLPTAHNVFNQLERGIGLFSMDFFVDNISDSQTYVGFTDHSKKTNKELLETILTMYREMNHPVYIRNCSFLGFHSYYIVVPGFSEARGFDLVAPINEYALGDSVYSIFRNVETASNEDLIMLLAYHKKISTIISKQNNFRLLAGLPMDTHYNSMLTNLTLAFAAYRLNKLSDAIHYLSPLLSWDHLDLETREYFKCVSRYLHLCNKQLPQEKIFKLLKKFYSPSIFEELYETIQTYNNPFHAYLLRCNPSDCEQCMYREHCSHGNCRAVFEKIGKYYQAFTDGQDEKYFTF